MDYQKKNAGFITSSKLKAFAACGFCFEQKYINFIPDPIADDNDNFVIGQAFDDLMTLGDDEFRKRYAVVKRRSDTDDGIIQLTETMSKVVIQMAEEAMANPLFSGTYRKHILEVQFGGLNLRGELDHWDLEAALKNPEENPIVDLKTCANLFTFFAHNYLFQMAYYQFMIEELYGIRVGAQLEVVDKFPHFARSRVYRIMPSTLLAERHKITRALEAYKLASTTGIFLPSPLPEEREKCPYYAMNGGHGRRKQVIIL